MIARARLTLTAVLDLAECGEHECEPGLDDAFRGKEGRYSL
jgi:hypothetical protein